jgi:hypothetical protein
VDVLERVRMGCAAVAERARQVRIVPDGVERLAGALRTEAPPLLPEERATGSPEAVAAEVVAWNMVNFGSGWFPELRKRPGLSGARSLATAFHDHVARHGPPQAGWLAGADAAQCAEVFEQPHPGPVDDLLELFARAWRDLGRLLLGHYDGSVLALVRAADGSAARLVELLDAMPLVHDVARYDGLAGVAAVEVPFYKRAQITASHLARALDAAGATNPGGAGATAGAGAGAVPRFRDLHRLTAFADNLVPHTLRMLGVLAYDDVLADRIARGELLEPGEPAEVEIRACGVWAVELLSRARGVDPATIDHQLWQWGQQPSVKAIPRHRCRSPFY